jgi:hypothetical protein
MQAVGSRISIGVFGKDLQMKRLFIFGTTTVTEVGSDLRNSFLLVQRNLRSRSLQLLPVVVILIIAIPWNIG